MKTWLITRNYDFRWTCNFNYFFQESDLATVSTHFQHLGKVAESVLTKVKEKYFRASSVLEFYH
jgi:hypothetical protein